MGPIFSKKGLRVWVVSENDNRGGKMAQHYESLGKKSWGLQFLFFLLALHTSSYIAKLNEWCTVDLVCK